MAASRPREVVPDAREAAEQQNDARRIAEASRGASPQYLSGPSGESYHAGGGRVDAGPVTADPEGSIQRAQTIIQSANANGAPSEAETRAAAEAYRVASAAQGDLARRQQGEGTRTTDVLA
ncbi:MAG TPA: hypothetical protein VMV03_11930 [Spirochaetia bacterium]|nr:hypothetical protein [Spirochaetia bacterium]